ncbi:DEAD/DEAH box helicase [Novosphingobium bradum]|uniref:DEAD/DEAH box helicase n=1 Tax=Novosphingobium bradum TaxID=1737444 RepID=A0ABV7IW91_9SPHN
MELVRERAVEAVLGQSGLNHPGLTAEIRRRFGSVDVGEGALVREPVIEGAAPFVSSGRTFADCAGHPLHPDVIRAISDDRAGDYRFPPDAQPYRHQLEAWEHLTAPDRRSVLVSSGTGSGKTECFLMPLLHDLATEAQAAGRLSGVRALALYPLNALIASQEERLRAWTAPFGGKVRFGLYNGLTPDLLQAQNRPGPEQVGDRATLRRDPPPILVTNVTMLEYMLVRRIDRPLIENSRGQLRWIILDEAHGYIGSAAAEIALLLRRVLLTFGVTPEDVRFVATSATIGGEGADVTDELRAFLRDISGTSPERVRVVIGEREKVLLPSPAAGPALAAADLVVRDAVAASPAVQAFVREAEAGPVPLARAAALLQPTGQPLEDVVEAVADNRDRQRGPLLPLRIHGFLRAIPGLWSCINPDCSQAPPDWPFGAVAVERVETCPHCASPVLEIKACRECGEPYLEAEERGGRLQPKYTAPTIDEFAVLRERELADEEDKGDEPETDNAATADDYEAIPLIVATRALAGHRIAHVEPLTGARHDQAREGTLPYWVHSPDDCGGCRAVTGTAGQVLRPFRYGAPFLIGNAAPVLLEGVPRRDLDGTTALRPPAEGRQLLSFTDSRQGTARFAANLQTASERGFVRGYVYHAVQGSMAAMDEDDPETASKRKTIADLEPIPAAAETVARLKVELAAQLESLLAGTPWPLLRDELARTDEVRKWMREVWQYRDDRYRADAGQFAEFLLLREFARRPRRANTAETMGLARLRFDAIDRATDVPQPLRDRGRLVADWQGLLYSMVDMVLRANLVVRANDNDLHWITRRGWRKEVVPFGEKAIVGKEIAFPMAGGAAASNTVLVIERALGLDRTEGRDRFEINEVLERAWVALQPVIYTPGQPGYALDFAKARIAPVTEAWLCPVTRRVLPATALGLTQYGHRERLATAERAPSPLQFPQLPVAFARGNQVEQVRAWLANDPQVRDLRERGVWSDLHDRAALGSPYLRAAEHSAQQPPARLRRFETAFKAGEINILNCSTTMEMGVDIGSVSAVMMTNVPPSLANYRQRVGRAGRRRQGFASSLTYTRDVPLDRETFADPAGYLARQTRAPRVRLDSRRIVQRHVNALLLARWFAMAGGEALKSTAGGFFGCGEGVGAARPTPVPAEACLAWLAAPSTETDLGGEVARLVAGTVLAGDRRLFDEARNALDEAGRALVNEWEAMQAQAAGASPEGRKSIEYQLQRMVRENLLKELAVRGVLPNHGLPTGVVPFVHRSSTAPGDDPDRDDASARRRSHPSRTLDIAIRDYAPGAEVVVDGLVYRSAGVPLNWQRPAEDGEAREIQNMKLFWTCPACGAADCAHVAPERCPACHAEVPFEAQRRFLEPAGFTVDMGEKPHADTDEVTYVEPESEQIVARGAAWQPLADPAQGRMRASSEGLVFYSSRGPGHAGYHVCLECGRAESAGSRGPGERPLRDHLPLRGTRRNAAGLCPGNDKTFKVTNPIALGHEAMTDVAELQPVGLESEGAAWAAIAALREALSRRLGIEPGELGMAVRPARTALGQRTHSLFLFDRASGGAGFAPQALAAFGDILKEARRILDCRQPGCIHGCSACVLTADLQRQQDKVDRIAALSWANAALEALGEVSEADRAAPGCVFSRSVADELVAAAGQGVKEAVVWAGPASDVAALAAGVLARLGRALADRGARLRLVVDPAWLDGLDPAARLALRDAARTLPCDLRKGAAPVFGNGAVAIAAAGGNETQFWASRDPAATAPGETWGQGGAAPAVRFAGGKMPLTTGIDPDSLLPASGTRHIELSDQLDGPLASFGERFAALLASAIRAAGGMGPLVRASYNDRYLQSPLVVRLMADALGGLRKALGAETEPLPVTVVTNRLKPNERQPYRPDHDWQWEEDRDAVLLALLEQRGCAPELRDTGANHGRTLTLHFAGGSAARVILDQGFGPWRTPDFARFAFGVEASAQARALDMFNAMIVIRGQSYVVVTK